MLQIYQEIAKRDPAARFILLGRGPLEKEVHSAIIEHGLSDKCLLISGIDDIGSFYSGIDCFVFPSKFEGLGMVLIEAQCAGLPCLATQGTIPSEVKLRNDFCFLPLDAGPATWAEVAIHNVTPSGQREDAYQSIIKVGRDIVETSKDYSKLIGIWM